MSYKSLVILLYHLIAVMYWLPSYFRHLLEMIMIFSLKKALNIGQQCRWLCANHLLFIRVNLSGLLKLFCPQTSGSTTFSFFSWNDLFHTELRVCLIENNFPPSILKAQLYSQIERWTASSPVRESSLHLRFRFLSYYLSKYLAI